MIDAVDRGANNDAIGQITQKYSLKIFSFTGVYAIIVRSLVNMV